MLRDDSVPYGLLWGRSTYTVCAQEEMENYTQLSIKWESWYMDSPIRISDFCLNIQGLISFQTNRLLFLQNTELQPNSQFCDTPCLTIDSGFFFWPMPRFGPPSCDHRNHMTLDVMCLLSKSKCISFISVQRRGQQLLTFHSDHVLHWAPCCVKFDVKPVDKFLNTYLCC